MYTPRTPLTEERANGLIDFANRDDSYKPSQRSLTYKVIENTKSIVGNVIKNPLVIPAFIIAGATAYRLARKEEHFGNNSIQESAGIGAVVGSLTGMIAGGISGVNMDPELRYSTIFAMVGAVVPMATNIISCQYESARLRRNNLRRSRSNNL